VRALALVVALAACHAPATRTEAPRAPTGTPVPRAPGVGTAVVVLPPGTPIAVLEGPFLVTTINPGSSMELAIALDRDCAAASLLWFSYSGSGVAVGAGETLCVRSAAEGPRTNGFSGYDPTYVAPR